MKSLIDFYKEWLPNNSVVKIDPYITPINGINKTSNGYNYLDLLGSILFYDRYSDYSLKAYIPVILEKMKDKWSPNYLKYFKKFADFIQAMQKEKLDNLQHLEESVLQSQLKELKISKNEIKIDAMDSLIQELSEEVFIKKAIESSFFFDFCLVKDRHNEIAEDLIGMKYVPVRGGKDKKGEILNQDQIKKFKIGTRRKQLIVSKFNEWNVFFDAFGNDEVIKLITKKTGYVVARGQQHSNFPNYVISHVWGNASDPRYFTNLWNVVLVPAWANFLMDKNTTEISSSDNEEILSRAFAGSTASKLRCTMKALCLKLYEEKLDWRDDIWKNYRPALPSDETDILFGKYNLKLIQPLSEGEKVGRITKAAVELKKKQRNN